MKEITTIWDEIGQFESYNCDLVAISIEIGLIYQGKLRIGVLVPTVEDTDRVIGLLLPRISNVTHKRTTRTLQFRDAIVKFYVANESSEKLNGPQFDKAIWFKNVSIEHIDHLRIGTRLGAAPTEVAI